MKRKTNTKTKRVTATRRLAKKRINDRQLRFISLLGVALMVGSIGLGVLVQTNAAATIKPSTSNNVKTSTSAASAQASLAKIIQNVKSASVYKYGAADDKGTAMDTAKVIANPAGGYLAVYHHTPSTTVKLATSKDLKKWTLRVNLDKGTQATIAPTSDKGFIVAHEGNNGGGFVKILHYPSLKALFAAKPDKTYSAKRTLSKCNEGTPNITSSSLKPDIAHSVIKINFHYHNGCNTDRQAVGTLTNFSKWTTEKVPKLDNAVLAAAKANKIELKGNIGDRDFMKYGGIMYTILEAQAKKGAQGENGSFATWRPYLYSPKTNKAVLLNIKTHKGSKSFANPTMTAAKGPDGSKGIIVTFFMPGEAAAKGEAGTVIYFVKTPKAGI